MYYIQWFLSIATAVLTAFKLFELYKEKKDGMKKIFFNPLGIGLILSLALTIIIFVLPWNMIHYGDCQRCTVCKPIHDTIRTPSTIIHDTLYIKKGTISNKIGKVGVMNESN
jgi:hypothetical protein